MSNHQQLNEALLDHLCEGYTVRQISDKLNIKVRTLEKRIETMRFMNNARTITQLVSIYLTNRPVFKIERGIHKKAS